MKTPALWNHRGVLAWLLWPLSFFYPALVWIRFLLHRRKKIGIPVICVGGLTAGGAGKTPVALHIGRLCKERGINAWFVSRGYKGTLHGPIQIKSAAHTSREVGDEPLLLSHMLPTIMAKNRRVGADFALRQGAELIITDDGLQSPTLYKDFSFAVVDGKNGFGNGFTLPAGPLREWPALAMKRVDAVILINPRPSSPEMPRDKTVITAHTITSEEAKNLCGKKVLAFCGLAIPQKFFATLGDLGAEIIDTRSFADHYTYSEREIETLAHEAKHKGAILVTTSKDAARLPPRLRALVTVVEIMLKFDRPELLEEILDSVITPPA